MGGWGGGGFGVVPWGGGALVWVPPAASFILTHVEPVRENTLRLTFTNYPRITGINDPGDCLDPGNYAITENVATTGADGKTCRPVLVTHIDAVTDDAYSLDVIVDRPFSPYPAAYSVTCTGLLDFVGNPLDPASLTKTFDGLLRTFEQQTSSAPRKDFASPMNLAAQLDPIPSAGDSFDLGTFVPDGAGDYAHDEGLVGLKKRILRRMFTTPGGFAFLPPNYGIGIQRRLKKNLTVTLREQIRADCERQIKEEPDVGECRVDTVVRDDHPGMLWILVRVRTRDGQGLKVEVQQLVGG